MNTALKEDIVAKPELIRKCWEHLNNNFHKFSETNQIKIALEICKKDQPNKVEGALNITMMPVVKVGDKSLELNIG